MFDLPTVADKAESGVTSSEFDLLASLQLALIGGGNAVATLD
jgi:hypothetical protein